MLTNLNPLICPNLMINHLNLQRETRVDHPRFYAIFDNCHLNRKLLPMSLILGVDKNPSVDLYTESWCTFKTTFHNFICTFIFIKKEAGKGDKVTATEEA